MTTSYNVDTLKDINLKNVGIGELKKIAQFLDIKPLYKFNNGNKDELIKLVDEKINKNDTKQHKKKKNTGIKQTKSSTRRKEILDFNGPRGRVLVLVDNYRQLSGAGFHFLRICGVVGSRCGTRFWSRTHWRSRTRQSAVGARRPDGRVHRVGQ